MRTRTRGAATKGWSGGGRVSIGCSSQERRISVAWRCSRCGARAVDRGRRRASTRPTRLASSRPPPSSLHLAPESSQATHGCTVHLQPDHRLERLPAHPPRRRLGPLLLPHPVPTPPQPRPGRPRRSSTAATPRQTRSLHRRPRDDKVRRPRGGRPAAGRPRRRRRAHLRHPAGRTPCRQRRRRHHCWMQPVRRHGRNPCPCVLPRDLLTLSSCSAFYATMLALAQPGDQVILPTPWYFNHAMTLEQLAISLVPLPCPAPTFLPSLSQCAQLVTPRTRAIVLVSPNNPTGAVYPPELLREFAALARENKVALVLDETYRDFVDGRPHGLFAETAWREYLVHLFSFSKCVSVGSSPPCRRSEPAHTRPRPAPPNQTQELCPPRAPPRGARRLAFAPHPSLQAPRLPPDLPRAPRPAGTRVGGGRGAAVARGDEEGARGEAEGVQGGGRGSRGVGGRYGRGVLCLRASSAFALLTSLPSHPRLSHLLSSIALHCDDIPESAH